LRAINSFISSYYLSYETGVHKGKKGLYRWIIQSIRHYIKEFLQPPVSLMK